LRNRPRSQRTSRPVKAHLSEQRSLRSKNRLSKATLYATLSALKRFFLWLAGQPVPDFVFRCRIFQPVGQGHEDRQGPSGGACTDPGSNPTHHQDDAGDHRDFISIISLYITLISLPLWPKPHRRIFVVCRTGNEIDLQAEIEFRLM